MSKQFTRKQDAFFVKDYVEFGCKARLAAMFSFLDFSKRGNQSFPRDIYNALIYEQILLLVENTLAIIYAFNRRSRYTFLESLSLYRSPDLNKPRSRLFSKKKFLEDISKIPEVTPKSIEEVFKPGAENMQRMLQQIRGLYRRHRGSYPKTKHGFIVVKDISSIFSERKYLGYPTIIELRKNQPIRFMGTIKTDQLEDLIWRSVGLIDGIVQPILKIYLLEQDVRWDNKKTKLPEKKETN